MRKLMILCLFAGLMSCQLFGQDVQCKAPQIPSATRLAADATKQPNQTADLPSVIASVQAAIDCYQANRGSGADALPPLASAVLDFKTTTGTVGGLSVSLFIFKLGASHERDTVNDLTFTYSPKAGPPRGTQKKAPKSLTNSLANGILAAGSAAKVAPTLAGIPLNKVSITVQFGIKNDGSVSLNVPVELVTLGPSFDRNRNDTQSVTLTFGQGQTN
jgi:hypothetical protein